MAGIHHDGQVGALASINLADVFTITARFFGDFWSDQLCASDKTSTGEYAPGMKICRTPETNKERLDRMQKMPDIGGNADPVKYADPYYLQEYLRKNRVGGARFYLSLEDDLLRIFGSERVAKIMDLLKIEEGEAITHGMISKAIENAQKKVEAHNFDIRKHLIEYDDVMNAQRRTVYALRQQLLLGRYAPEEVDETGKRTGESRTIALNDERASLVGGPVAGLVGMFCGGAGFAGFGK